MTGFLLIGSLKETAFLSGGADGALLVRFRRVRRAGSSCWEAEFEPEPCNQHVGDGTVRR